MRLRIKCGDSQQWVVRMKWFVASEFSIRMELSGVQNVRMFKLGKTVIGRIRKSIVDQLYTKRCRTGMNKDYGLDRRIERQTKRAQFKMLTQVDKRALCLTFLSDRNLAVE